MEPNNPKNKLGKGGKVGGAKQRANNANIDRTTDKSNKRLTVLVYLI
jgi:hypothetical protein